jgi:hypothetical protein
VVAVAVVVAVVAVVVVVVLVVVVAIEVATVAVAVVVVVLVAAVAENNAVRDKTELFGCTLVGAFELAISPRLKRARMVFCVAILAPCLSAKRVDVASIGDVRATCGSVGWAGEEKGTFKGALKGDDIRLRMVGLLGIAKPEGSTTASFDAFLRLPPPRRRPFFCGERPSRSSSPSSKCCGESSTAPFFSPTFPLREAEAPALTPVMVVVMVVMVVVVVDAGRGGGMRDLSARAGMLE